MFYSNFDEEEIPEQEHPPLSPANGAESLFLAGLATANISANALAEQLRRNTPFSSSSTHKSSMSVTTVATDDFVSAIENPDDLLSIEDYFEDDNINRSLFQETIPELDGDSDTDTPEHTSRGLDFTMSTTAAKPTTIPTPVPAPKKELKKTPPPSSSPTSTEPQVDAASHVYEHAKGVWSWGKGVPVVNMFLGVTEAVAGKVVGVAGTNLSEIDGTIQPQLAKLDSGVLNPAISALVSVLLGAAGKTEDIVKPIIIMLLSPFGLIKNEAENPEITSKK